MKKVLAVLFILLSITTIVSAKTYNVASENMIISLSDDYIDLLSEFGFSLNEPYIKKLDKEIWELRLL